MNCCTKEELIAFERRMAELWEAGELPYLIHLSGGNEGHLIEIFREVRPGDWVFASHRNHYHALLSGMKPDKLERLIREGNSMFVYGKAEDRNPKSEGMAVNFFTSSILAGTCAIAAGVAWELKMRSAECGVRNGEPHVWCFLGDGAEDEGHFYEAVRFAAGHYLPLTFIIEDNDRSVDTSKLERFGRSYQPGLEIFGYDCVRRYCYVPTYPHAGSGCKHRIEFKQRGAP